MSTYTVRYERDQDDWWFASVPRIPGCWTQGRTIGQARRRIREALGLWVRDAKTATLVDDVRLPAGIRRRVKVSHVLMTETARTLTKKLRLTPADAGAVMGVPPAWVKALASLTLRADARPGGGLVAAKKRIDGAHRAARVARTRKAAARRKS